MRNQQPVDHQEPERSQSENDAEYQEEGGPGRWRTVRSRGTPGDEHGACVSRPVVRQAQERVRLAPCNDGSYQKWELSKNTYGWQIRSRHWNTCLDMNATPAIYTHSCNSGNYQRWAR
ncbi:ricin-type beta-trefoil lectin domain protein [Streptomyces griseus]|uniref:RICIN domain-containing protein n=1 Tax=Streptomyces griseus TaxID=1911 RepID=UPI00099D8EF6